MRRISLLLALSLLTACTGSIDEAPPVEAEDDTGAAIESETGVIIDEDSGAPIEEDSSAPIEEDGSTPDGAITDASVTDSAKPKDGAVATDSAADTTKPIDSAVDAVTAGPSSTRHTPYPLDKTDAPNGYYEYLPPGYSKTGATSPIMIFWHGLGEDGDGKGELAKVLVNGPPKLIKADKWPASRPWIVLSPQNPSGCPSAASIKAFITWSLAHYNVDLKRVYLTGVSCGAIGSWDYLNSQLATTPVAAAVLIAGNGGGAWDNHHCDLGKMAIWAFHGDADGTVAPSGSTYPMTQLIACPKPPRRDAQMTLYPGVGHDSWTRTYDLSAGHDIYAWMLDNHL